MACYGSQVGGVKEFDSHWRGVITIYKKDFEFATNYILHLETRLECFVIILKFVLTIFIIYSLSPKIDDSAYLKKKR